MTMRGNDGERMDRKEEAANGRSGSGDIIIINNNTPQQPCRNSLLKV